MSRENERELTELSLSGFKSILTKQSVRLSTLTLLSGANSSGKSSITQALLLLKQTIEAPYDPGALLLNGPNVRMTSTNQALARSAQLIRTSFSVGLTFSDKFSYETFFRREMSAPGGFELDRVKITWKSKTFELSQKSTPDEISNVIDYIEKGETPFKYFLESGRKLRVVLERNRCEFDVRMYRDELGDPEKKRDFFFSISLPEAHRVRNLLQGLIHVPGLRGNPERTYATTAVGSNFPGRFENYVASIIRHWQETKSEKFEYLNSQLQFLGLTSSLRAQRRSDTEVELRVSRKKNASAEKLSNLVSIADVGFGVSQILPVLVALLVAEKGQFVVIEQPELHLHPRAQTKLAEVIAASVNRGIHVIIETHSSLLLLGLQTSVARGTLSQSKIALNWFATNENGHTRISQGEVDKLGAIGHWPADFMDVRLDAESDYLEAVENQLTQSNEKNEASNRD